MSEWVSEWQGHLLSCCGQLKTLSCFDATTQPDYKFYNSETTMLWSRCMVSTQSEGRSLCTWASPSSPHRSPSPSGWEPSLVAWLVLSQYEKCILTMDVSPALVVGPSAYSGIYIGVWSYSALLTGHFPPLLTLFFDPRSGISFESYSSSIQPELQCTSHSRHSGVRLSHALYFSRLLKYLILVKS